MTFEMRHFMLRDINVDISYFVQISIFCHILTVLKNLRKGSYCYFITIEDYKMEKDMALYLRCEDIVVGL